MKHLELKLGEAKKIDSLISELIDFGYERAAEVNSFGQFSVAGGNLSIYPVNESRILRVDFFGHEIDDLFLYSKDEGISKERLQSFQILPNQLVLPDKSKILVGDYVVHEDHGIGIFRSLGIKKVQGEDRQYIFIEYLNNSFLYLPVELINSITKYIGIGRYKPKLSRLGSSTWQKTYKKTYENVLLLARELLNLYASRSITKREAWKIDPGWNEATIKTFPYRDTPDQAQAIKDVYGDLQKDIPMDRLVSGDVGFGKTEVALRAVSQAVANGHQVAILVPTTILVEQHFVTFAQRLRDLPVSIERLSRFVKADAQSEIVKKVNAGSVDILIGTHRLLGEDIKFQKLGLLVIDEEQKFGVKQKEKLKNLRASINVLCLSATPIPRTLFMSLSGIRDISTITSPPMGRKEIETVISPYDEKIIKQAITNELDRKGQIYYLHNEVQSIGGTKNKLSKMFPDIRIDVAHGQLDELTLAERMKEFTSGKIDILVCSTIIENGLDLPNVNTLIVEEADNFGLSQLYQIRGRIGRSKKQAHAIFTYAKKKISDNAFKRLKALAENTELGSGFNIAFSDLEIRGGGNILGKEQHGNMEAVGLVLYSKLLKMAVDRLRSKP